MTETHYGIGDKLKDRVSGYEGIVMAVTYYSTGCIQYGVALDRTNKDGGLEDWQWFDQSRVELVTNKAINFNNKSWL